MKHNLPSFFAGIACALLVSVLSVSALAATGTISITVDPTVKIQVNGTAFQPKDAKGKAVPVFIYNGTTYAPLRGLAEAYGLEVGYDAATGTATVGKQGSTAMENGLVTRDESSKKAKEEFSSMWKPIIPSFNQDAADKTVYMVYDSDKNWKIKSADDLYKMLNEIDKTIIKENMVKLAVMVAEENGYSKDRLVVHFCPFDSGEAYGNVTFAGGNATSNLLR